MCLHFPNCYYVSFNYNITRCQTLHSALQGDSSALRATVDWSHMPDYEIGISALYPAHYDSHPASATVTISQPGCTDRLGRGPNHALWRLLAASTPTFMCVMATTTSNKTRRDTGVRQCTLITEHSLSVAHLHRMRRWGIAPGIHVPSLRVSWNQLRCGVHSHSRHNYSAFTSVGGSFVSTGNEEIGRRSRTTHSRPARLMHNGARWGAVSNGQKRALEQI